ncbi:telomeric repeat-binding factor 2-interacting protein 1 isoform X2 [Motacilla alba alba]|uniref:telomeric repeat-binding factor 2-interacting protein 1 isoform X2 n=1 Tax=Motacilla alba alba TaxID=1094192 RepID=UPI0018D59FFD|nr:telomeric repeat-binding factor 2-interacting protein 1 isoform X2 [Motacilla alba alba]
MAAMAAGGAGAAMAGGQAGAARSRSLFLWDDGHPMRFYLRPGLAKLRLAPLVLAGGGRLCRVQEPGAVLLAQPGEVAPDGAVSTEYVAECVKRNQRLPLEPFLLTARGRLAFTEAEDAALLQAVRGQGMVRVSGRALWIELERSGLTRHSWQAMRDRYLRHLLPRLWGERGHSGGAGLRGGVVATSVGRCGLADDPRVFPQSPRRRRIPRRSGVCSRQLIGSSKARSVVGQVVETMERFMEKFAVDLLTVTQAFLKNSGDVEATSYFLQTGQRLDGYPVWSRQDDLELQKDDEHVRNKLIAKFGAENVAKRIVFRES